MSKILIVALVGISLWFAISIGGVIEGKFYPVVKPADIQRVEPAGDVSTRIWGRAVRLRNCSFQRLEWRLGTEAAFSVVDLDFEESSKVRNSGRFQFGPWRLHLTPDQLSERSYAIVFHRCHRLWLTQTRFYR